MFRKEVNKVRISKVKVGSLVGEPRQIPTCRRRPGMPQLLNTQRLHFTFWTIPNLFPNARIYLFHLWLRPLPRPTTFTPISLCPLPPPLPHIRLRPKTTALGCSTVILRIGIFNAMAVENVNPPLGLTAVEGEGSLIQGWGDGSESCEKSGCVGSTGEEGGESSAVGFTACVETRFVDCV